MIGGLGQLPGCIMLVCAFLLLAQNRVAALIVICRVQGIALGAAAIWQGHVQNAAGLYLTAGIIFAAGGMLMPAVMRRIARANKHLRPAVPAGVSVVLGVGLVGVAILATPLAGFGFAIALAMMLIGLLMLVRQRELLGLVIGFLCIGNALVLTAVSLPALPLVWPFALAASALVMLPAAIFEPGDASVPAGRPGA